MTGNVANSAQLVSADTYSKYTEIKDQRAAEGAEHGPGGSFASSADILVLPELFQN
jgi:hypothetical protein